MDFHEPVLLSEVLQRLGPAPDKVICDGTLGSAGHGVELVRALRGKGVFVGLDRDPAMLDKARERLQSEVEGKGVRLILRACRYEMLPEVLQSEGLSGVDGMLLDLGFNSLQIEDAERGFGFLKDGPLDGRYDPSEAGTRTMADLVNNAGESELCGWFREFGGEHRAKAIARRIVQERTSAPITRTAQLAELISSCFPPKERHGRIHPATRCFQSLRIVVNDELGCVERGIRRCLEVLNPGAVLVTIGYHSGEDRVAKQVFDEFGSPRPDPDNVYSATTTRGLRFRVESRGALKPSEAEIERNPRARSARLRSIRRLEVAT
ncbi:16S rRNA (cytosine(1402)-N(4))-methyltransferase RsmH [Candidatus Poribacteria bacterium]|nr:16S rRNA (cytosine(1402)-N(4))-methyltransferase RsmH [Candidatus Poribacteria bacterium]